MARKVIFEKKDIESNKNKAILSYIFAPCVYYSKKAKKSKWLKFHARQGMNLFITELFYLLISIILLDNIVITKECTYTLYGISFYCGEENPMYLKIIVALFGFLILCIIISGIVNVINKEGKELSLIGKFKLFK